ncbi:MAG: cation transporter [Lachnospiraceae bacterium]|nr:cation transporter [Lachnospiraceae bacterium]
MRKKKRKAENSGNCSETRILIAFLLNLIFTFVEVAGSMLTGSVTILSDAIHDFGDCIALGMAWRMEKLSRRPANERYQFGYRRFSVVAGLINNMILLMGGVILIVTSVQRFFDPRPINGKGMLVFAVFGILINGVAMMLTARGKSINEKTISMHMLEDVLTWVAVLAVGAVMCFYELPVLDSVLSIGMTFVIFVGVLRNLKKIFGIITFRSPLELQEYRKLQAALAELIDAGAVEELRIYSMDGEDKNAEVCVVLYEEMGREDLIQLDMQTRMCCKSYGISKTVVQLRYFA